MIPLFKVRVSESADKSVSEVLHSGFIGQGPAVDEFEDLLQVELNTKTRPITVNSCTSAIDLALELKQVSKETDLMSLQSQNLDEKEMQKKMEEIMQKPLEVTNRLFALLDEYQVMNGKVLED